MSGVYIKGMDMPRACVWRTDGHLRTCPLYDIDGYCGAINSEACHKEEEHHHDCPAFFVPDHGRLIDADALTREQGFRDYKYVNGLVYVSVCEVVGLINAAPTIIPADRKEEK